MVELGALRRDIAVDFGDSLEHRLAAGSLVFHLGAAVRGRGIQLLELPEKITRLLLQARDGVVIALDALETPVNRPLQFVAAATRRIVLLSDERKLLLHLARSDAALRKLLGNRHRGDFERPQLVLARGDLGHKYLAPVGSRDLCAGWPRLGLALARDFRVFGKNARKRSVRDFVPAALYVAALLVDLGLNLGKRCLALGERILRGGKRLGEKTRLLVEGIDLHGDLLELRLSIGNLALVALCKLAVLLDALRIHADDLVGAAVGVVRRRLARRERLETLFELVHLGVELLLPALRLGHGTRCLFNRLVDVAPIRRVLHKLLVKRVYLLLRDVDVEDAQLVVKFLVLLRLADLTLERADLALHLLEDVGFAQQVLLGLLDLPQGLLAVGLELRDSRRLLEHAAAVFGLGGENRVDLALGHDGVRRRADAGAHQEVLNVPEAARLLV